MFLPRNCRGVGSRPSNSVRCELGFSNFNVGNVRGTAIQRDVGPADTQRSKSRRKGGKKNHPQPAKK